MIAAHRSLFDDVSKIGAARVKVSSKSGQGGGGGKEKGQSVDQDKTSARDLPKLCGQWFHQTIDEKDKHAEKETEGRKTA